MKRNRSNFSHCVELRKCCVLNGFIGLLNQFNPYHSNLAGHQLHNMTSDLVLVCSLITVVTAYGTRVNQCYRSQDITGHIGFRTLVFALHAGYNIRGVVRKQDQDSRIRSQKSIKPFLDQLEIIVIPELFVRGAFDDALRGVNLIIHITSPLPHKVNDTTTTLVCEI